MKADYRKGRILARGKKVDIGIDVHKGKWHVTARVDGEEVFHGSMPGESSVKWLTIRVVRERGVEPLRISPLDPKSSASASSATLACLILKDFSLFGQTL